MKIYSPHFTYSDDIGEKLFINTEISNIALTQERIGLAAKFNLKGDWFSDCNSYWKLWASWEK